MISAEADSKRRAELAKFLRLRREATRPEMAGFSGGGRRRTPGLRREEVASLAFVGVTWYTWLEQGRDIRASNDTLIRIAKALRLSSADTSYLLALAGYEGVVAQVGGPVDDRLQKLLDGFTAGPALVLNARADCTAFNRLADLVYRMDNYKGPFANNFVWRAFMDPVRSRLYGDWENWMPQFVGLIRARYGNHFGDPEFEALIKMCREQSPDFARMWEEHHTVSLDPVTVTLILPRYGPVRVHSVRLLYPNLPEHMVMFLPPADVKTVKIFEKLDRQAVK